MATEHLMPSTSNFCRNEHLASSLKGAEENDSVPKSPQGGATADSSQNATNSVIAFTTASQFHQPHQNVVPERRKKKPYKELTLEEKVELIRMAEENSSLSQASIAEKYSIAKSNVCRILQRKAEYLRAFESAGFAGSRKRKLRGDLIPLRHFHPKPSMPVMSTSSSCTSNNNSLDSVIIETPEATAIARPIARNPFDCGDSRAVHATASASNETLRMHMAKQHSIARLFMCRCCNWAFPDKTSLHMHVQSKEEGKSISHAILGKGIPHGSDQLGNLSIPGMMSSMGHPQSQNLTHAPNPFASLHSTASAMAGLPFSGESLAQFFPPFSLMHQNNEELMGKLRERLFLNPSVWPTFPNTSENNLITKLSKKDHPTNVNSNEGLDQVVNSVTSNSSTDDSEEIQVIEDVHENESQSRESPSKTNNATSNDGDLAEKDALSSSEKDDLLKHIPKNYFTDETLRIDEDENSQLNIVDLTETSPERNMNEDSPSATNSSVSPSNSSSASATSCYHCSLFKTKLTLIQTRCSYLEVHSATTQQEALRLREQNKLLMEKLLECREKTLSFMQSEQSLPFVLNEILKVTLFP